MTGLIEKVVNKLAWLRIKPFLKIEGFLSVDEAIRLYRLASGLSPGSTIVEIGCWKGKSTFCLARGLSRGRLYVIDPFDASGDEESLEEYQKTKGKKTLLQQFMQNMEDYDLASKITVLEGLSDKFAGSMNHVDLLFIDGDHSRTWCEFDYLSYSPGLKRGGYLLFHDYDSGRKEFGVTWVVENVVMPSGDYECVGVYDSLWIGKKK